MEKVNFIGTLNNSVDAFNRDSIILETRSKELHDEAMIAKGKALGIQSTVDFIYKNNGHILSDEEFHECRKPASKPTTPKN